MSQDYFLHYTKIYLTESNRSTDEHDEEEFDEIRRGQDRGQRAIMGRAPFTEGHLIDARLSSTESLLHSNRERLSPNLIIDETSHSRNVSAGDRTYSSVMKLCAGSMDGYTDYHDIYSGIRNAKTDSDSNKETSVSSI